MSSLLLAETVGSSLGDGLAGGAVALAGVGTAPLKSGLVAAFLIVALGVAATALLSIYRGEGGNWVWATGSMDWSWALSPGRSSAGQNNVRKDPGGHGQRAEPDDHGLATHAPPGQLTRVPLRPGVLTRRHRVAERPDQPAAAKTASAEPTRLSTWVSRPSLHQRSVAVREPSSRATTKSVGVRYAPPA